MMEMIKDTLKAMAGGVGSVNGMAKALGISREDTEARIEELQKMGYIEPLPEHMFKPQSSGCMGCGMSTACSDGEGPATTEKTYMLTDKGIKVAFE